MNADLMYSRLLLKEVLAEIKAAGVVDAKKAYVMRVRGMDQYEFFYGKYYDGAVSASDAYEARAKGWMGYLRSIGKKDAE